MLVESHLAFVTHSTVFMVQNKYGALLKYAIGKEMWKSITVSQLYRCRDTANERQGTSSGQIQNLMEASNKSTLVMKNFLHIGAPEMCVGGGGLRSGKNNFLQRGLADDRRIEATPHIIVY